MIGQSAISTSLYFHIIFPRQDSLIELNIALFKNCCDIKLDFALMRFSMAAAALFEGLFYHAVTIDGSEIIYVATSKPKKLASFWQILRIPINQSFLKGNGEVMIYAA